MNKLRIENPISAGINSHELVRCMRISVFCATLALFLWRSLPAVAQPTSGPVSVSGEKLTLEECVRVAVKENKTIKNAYLDRIVQKYDLRVAEDKFTPKMILSPGILQSATTTSGAGTNSSTAVDLSATATESLPTGGAVSLTARHGTVNTETSGTDHNYGWNISLIQPLLKGGGFEVGTASLRTARISELNNILALKTTITDTLTSVITAYRDYVRALKELAISRQSFERGKELVEINKELIAAGRMAEIDIIQSEADVAGREFSLLQSENSLDAARLALVKIMGIDKSTRIVPVESMEVEPIPYQLEQAKKIAFENRPDYLSALQGVEVSRINLMLAKNSQLWDLSLTAGYAQDYARGGQNNHSDSDSWTAGLKLSIPFGDMTIYQGYLNAKVSQEKLELNLSQLKENISIEVEDALRDADMKMRQVKLARQARLLSEKKVEIETEKLKVGRSTNFQLVSFQNDLVNAQNSELSSIISYLNALTTIDRTLGITLDRWRVALVTRQGE
jgi:outer membrane protein TolC